MNSRHRKTLVAVFTEPVSPSIVWSDIENLLVALECNMIEGSSSRVRFEKDGLVVFFHRPHPGKEAKRHHVRDARLFLQRLGVGP